MNGIAIGVGAVAACAVLLLALTAARLVRAVPHDDARSTRDVPLALRPIWPLVAIVAYYIGPRLTASYRERVLKRLRRAEIDGWILPQHWIALRVVAALAAVCAGSASLTSGAALAVPSIAIAGIAGWALPQRWLMDRIEQRAREIVRELPAFLDVLTVAIESGMGLVAAMTLCADKMQESPLRRATLRALGEIRAGRPRLDALEAISQRLDVAAFTAFVAALRHAERTGASLGALLRAQSSQRLTERFARAEKLAMQAPVKMLGPLIACIFPCTFIVLGFPIVVRLMEDI